MMAKAKVKGKDDRILGNIDNS